LEVLTDSGVTIFAVCAEAVLVKKRVSVKRIDKLNNFIVSPKSNQELALLYQPGFSKGVIAEGHITKF
jgi:hypothetical protein